MNRMKKLLVVFALVLCCIVAKTQIVVNVQMPQVGLHLNSQLWNLTLVNAGNAGADIRIDMIVSEAQSGDPVLAGSSRVFYLPTGTRPIQLTDLMPIQYNVINSSYGASVSPDGFLPVGNYIVCFSIFKRGPEEFEKIAEECETITVEPASPPILVYPEDEAVITENRPVFLWIPPSPVFLFSNLSYELVLVEILENQQPGDAVQNNLPLLQQNNVMYPFLAYPPALPALDTGKLYAWMVKASNNYTPVSNSEVYSFRLQTAKDSIKIMTRVYTVLKSPDEMKFTYARNSLYYEYANNQANDTLVLELLDVTTAQTKKIALSQVSFVPVKSGQNFLTLPLEPLQGMVNHHIYILNARNRNEKIFALKFIYQTAE